MKQPLHIEIDDESDQTCGSGCPFLDHDVCLLFKEDLDETVLPEGYVWQKEGDQTRERCFRCYYAF